MLKNSKKNIVGLLKAINNDFRFGIQGVLDPWPHSRVKHKLLQGGFSDLCKINIHKMTTFFPFISYLFENRSPMFLLSSLMLHEGRDLSSSFVYSL